LGAWFAWRASGLVTGFSWGVFYCATIVLFGIDSWTFLVVTICVAGICAAGTAVFAPHLPTLRSFVILLLVPAIGELCLEGRQGFGLAAMFALFLGFSLYQGRNASLRYWRAWNADWLEIEKNKARGPTKPRTNFWLV
jgi:hypothetical protein